MITKGYIAPKKVKAIQRYATKKCSACSKNKMKAVKK